MDLINGTILMSSALSLKINMKKKLTFILLLIFQMQTTQLLGQVHSQDIDKSIIQDTITLREVVVKNSRPISQLKDDGIVTTIKGSILENLGSARDVLGYLPGVTNMNGSVEVFGKGAPMIYINGRKMRDGNELDQIRSDKIKEIKVINNPGSRYDASVNAVIRIYTERDAGEGFSLDAKTATGFHDYWYGKENIYGNYRTNGLDVFGMLEYDRSKAKASSSNIQEAWTKSYYMTDIALNQKNNSRLYQGQLGFDYTTAEMQSFGLYYKYSRTPSTVMSSLNSSTFLNDSVLENSIMQQYYGNKNYEHLVDGYYSGNIEKWTLDATFDLLWKNTRSDRTTVEDNTINVDRNIAMYDKSSGRMIAAEVHLSHHLFKGNINLGMEFVDSKRSDDFKNPQELLVSSNNDINETTTAFYAELLQNFGKVSTRLGLRYEYVNSRYYDNGSKEDEQSRNYGKFFPSLLVTVPFKVSALQLSYSRKYKRPLYSQLNSTVYYENRYFYESGNPYLQPSFIDAISLVFKYRWLIAIANYNHIKDRIISLSAPYSEDESIMLMKKVNSPSDANEWQVMLQAQPTVFGRNYFPSLSVGLMGQFYKLDYCDRIKKFNNPIPTIRFNNIIRLPNNYMLTSNLSWRGKGESENISLGQTWQIDLAATKTFGKHWEVRAVLNDVFNTSGNTDFSIYSDNSLFYTNRDINARLVEFSIRYKLNISKSKYKGKGAGNTEKLRL